VLDYGGIIAQRGTLDFLDRLLVSDPWPEGDIIFENLGGKDYLGMMIGARRFKSFKFEKSNSGLKVYRCCFLYGDKNLLEISISVREVERSLLVVRVTSSENRWFRPQKILFSRAGLFRRDDVRDVGKEGGLTLLVEQVTGMSLSF